MRYYDALQSIGQSRDVSAMYRGPDSKTPQEPIDAVLLTRD